MNQPLNKHQDYSDGKYSIFTFSGDNDKFRKITCSQESICILPFCLNEKNQIKDVYLSKYGDAINNNPVFTCITKTLNSDANESFYELLEELIENELEIKEIEVDDIYFLGNIKHTIPFYKEYKCYGVNLTEYLDAPFKSNLGENRLKSRNSIERVRFSELLSGRINDSLALATSLILLSYFEK